MADYGKNFEGVEGPSDAELRALEDHHEIYGDDFSPELVKSLQEKYAQIDPGYARIRSARMHGRGQVEGPSMTSARIQEPSLSTQDELVAGGSSSRATSSDFDVADTFRSVSGAPLTGGRSTYYDEAKETPAYAQGVFLLRTAGNCNHPRCQHIRARGMELMGATDRYNTGKRYWEAQGPEIPSIRTDKKSGTGTYAEYEPADKKSPEWRNLVASTSPSDIFSPSDFLQHHHGPEDADFVKNPLPFDI